MKREDQQLWDWFTRRMRGPVAGLSLRRHPKQIDLHGMTLNAAHSAVNDFLRETPHKRVIVITGRSGEMVREFPHWVDGWNATLLPNGGSFELTRLRNTSRRL